MEKLSFQVSTPKPVDQKVNLAAVASLRNAIYNAIQNDKPATWPEHFDAFKKTWPMPHDFAVAFHDALAVVVPSL